MEYDNIRHAELAKTYKNGSNWFYWLAGLTIVTSLIAFGGGGIRFLLSLGVTQIIDGIAAGLAVELGSGTKAVALVLDLIVSGIFVLFGYLSNQKQIWAYVIGMVLFLFDGLLSLVVGDLIGVAAHAFVLYFLIRGFLAGRQLLELEKAMAQQAAMPQTEPAL
jgi:hypothetical protein